MAAYYSIFESYLRYGIVAWGGGGTTVTNLQKVLVVQKRDIRALKGLEPLASCQEAFKDLGIVTVGGLYIQEIILFAIRSGQTRTSKHQYNNTRHRINFLLDQH